MPNKCFSHLHHKLAKEVKRSNFHFYYFSTDPYFHCLTLSLVKPAHCFVTSYFGRLGSPLLFLFCFVFILKESKQASQVRFLYNAGLNESQLCPDPL